MKKCLPVVLSVLLILRSAYASDLILYERKDADSPTGIYIPADLKEAGRELRSALDPDFKEDLESRPLFAFHSFESVDLVEWMIEAWGLEEDSRLAKYFQKKGITKASSMAFIVIYRWEEREQGIYTSEEAFLKEQVEREESLEDYLNLPPKADGSPPDPPPFRD
jgi:hypothetical protein